MECRLNEAIKLITEAKGIYSVRFRKKNGEMRDMVCRNGVDKGIKGTGSNVVPSDYGLIRVFDMEKDGLFPPLPCVQNPRKEFEHYQTLSIGTILPYKGLREGY